MNFKYLLYKSLWTKYLLPTHFCVFPKKDEKEFYKTSHFDLIPSESAQYTVLKWND